MLIPYPHKAKFYLPAIVLSLLAMISCHKKESGILSYSVSFKVNGNSVSFSVSDSASISQVSDSPYFYNVFNLGAFQTDSLGSSSISLAMSDSNSITTGIYNNDENSLNPSPFFITINYVSDSGQVYVSSDYLGTTSYIPLPEDNIISITEISSTYIQGTFQGTLVPVGASSGNYITITDGEFTVYTRQ
jgi:hypothetical protein